MAITPGDLFAALGHDTRVRCLVVLPRRGELCVCERTDALGASQPHASRHLAAMPNRPAVPRYA